MNPVGKDLEETVEDAVPLLGIDLFGQRYGALHVGEEDGHLLPLAFEGAARSQDLLN
jgi:hypothetical protein